MVYGLNPDILDVHNPNSPFYEEPYSPCDHCKTFKCEVCDYNEEKE